MGSLKIWILPTTIISMMSSLDSANILGIFYINSRSHYSFAPPLMEALAARGHNVTVISYFKSGSNLTNYTQLLINEETHSYVDNYNIKEDTNKLTAFVDTLRKERHIEKQSCYQLLSSDFIQKLIKSKTKQFDLMLAEMWHSQCFRLLSHVLDIPLIALLPMSSEIGPDIAIGNFINPSVVPVQHTPHSLNMNFYERMVNTLAYGIFHLGYYTFMNDYMTEVSKGLLNIDLPPADVLHRRLAAIFYCNHFSFKSKPDVPNVFNVAGLHIKEAKPLPKDLQEFIDGAKDGVIFFSFGSTVKVSSIHPEKLRAIAEVFSAIPQRVIWRTNELNMTNLSENVKTGTWFPQRDILEHKNVRAFISHCGLFSTLEAIHTATPVIGIPFFFDQFQNARRLVECEVGVLLTYKTIDKNVLLGAVNEVLKDNRYQNNIQKLSKIFKDRPMSPLDTAIYWTEYVLRHNGAAHLRVTAAEMPFYQYALLDVLVFIFVTLAAALYLLKYLSYKIISRLFKDKKKYKNQ